MITPVFPVFEKRRVHRPRPSIAPPALVLELASFFLDAGMVLHLRFERDVDVASVYASQIRVADGPSSQLYGPTGAAVLVDPRTVRLSMAVVGPAGGGPDVLLTASDRTGIVAADGGGGTWPGVADLVLPFGAP